MNIVDAWMQHPTPRLWSDEMFETVFRWTRTEHVDRSAPLPIEATLASLDAGRVTTGLVCAWVGPQGALVSNDEVAEFVRASAGRLVGVASVDIRKPMKAVRELRRCVRELGMRALRAIPWLWGVPPNDRRFYPLYAECIELGIPFCTQVGHTGPLRSSEPGRPIPYLDEVALDWPELVIVGGHIGYPWTEEMISLARKYKNVHIDTSAYSAKRYPPELVRYLKAEGRKKVLFVSNYPMLTHAKALDGLDALGLDEETLALFLEGNARRVFSLAPLTTE